MEGTEVMSDASSIAACSSWRANREGRVMSWASASYRERVEWEESGKDGRRGGA